MSSLRRNERRRTFTLEALEDRRLMAIDSATDPLQELNGFGMLPAAEVASVALCSTASAIVVDAARLADLSSAVSRADTKTSTTMKLVGDVPGGLRGEKTTFTVLLRDAAGKPLAGQRVNFSESYGGRDRDVGSDTTDASGYATLTYKIPSSPNADNIALTARFGGTSRYKSSSCTVSHVEIGRSNPEVGVKGPSASVDEGSKAVFTFRLSQSMKVPVIVTYATADRSATSGPDYFGATGSITLAPGETSKSVSITTLADAAVDPDESFSMKIVSVTGAKLGSSTSTATIRDTTPPPPADAGSWTVFVYMTGSNLNDYARDDINEMEKALGSLPSSVRIVVSWDQPAVGGVYATGNGSQTAWKTYGRSVLTADSNMSSIASRFDLSFGERNTGDPATLVDFVKWGVERAPAQHYMLQMWGHGGGFVGSQFDTESGDDPLSISEMTTALGTQGMPTMEVVAYDNCLMGMAEVGAAIAPAVSGVFVASEELVGGPGQDYKTAYSRLAVANPASVTAAQLADGMVASYQRQYQGVSSKQDTLSSVVTSGYADLNKAIGGFVSACRGLGEPQRNAMIAAAKASPVYAKDYGYANADLAAFMTRVGSNGALPQAVREAAAKVGGATKSMVATRTTDQRGSGGIAVFMPLDAKNPQLAGYSANAAAFCQATGWDQFARWMATGASMANASSAASGRAASRLDGLSGTISQMTWAAYAAEVAAPAGTESRVGFRRIRV
jgi:hypothetical protein